MTVGEYFGDLPDRKKEVFAFIETQGGIIID